MFAALPAIVERRGWNPDPIDPTNVSLFGRVTTMANQVRDQLITGLTIAAQPRAAGSIFT